jgi:hypothetical protein
MDVTNISMMEVATNLRKIRIVEKSAVAAAKGVPVCNSRPGQHVVWRGGVQAADKFAVFLAQLWRLQGPWGDSFGRN